MAFEVFYPTRACLALGQAGLNSVGQLTFNAVDLQTAGIRDTACILIDRELKRLAVRKPSNNDPAKRLTFNKSKNAAHVNISGALKAMGFTAPFKPRKFAAMAKEGRLEILLDDRPGARAMRIA